MKVNPQGAPQSRFYGFDPNSFSSSLTQKASASVKLRSPRFEFRLPSILTYITPTNPFPTCLTPPKMFPRVITSTVRLSAPLRTLSTPPPITPRYILTYQYPPTILSDRIPHRPGHVGLAKKFKQKGTLLYAGGVSGPLPAEDKDTPTEGVFLFTDEGDAREFASSDPYVIEGIVGEWNVREWACVITPE